MLDSVNPLALGPAIKPTRVWGDGGNDQREHVIEDISYGRDFLLCRCGAELTDIRDGRAWSAHALGTGVMRLNRVEDRVVAASADVAEMHQRSSRALEELALFGLRCICTPASDITLCPNYVDGDEQEDDDD